MIVWKHALLTGATGALGSALAADLLASNPTGTLAVLIRPDAGSIDQRFNDWLGSVENVFNERSESAPAWKDRVIPVSADVRQSGMGIEPSLSKHLQQNTDLVVHAAADTGFKSAEQDQWNTNVEGTRHAIAWARGCCKSPRFILVSTVCTSGARTGRILETFSHEPPEFVTHYERTKWEAEKLTIESGLHVGLARVSIVMGSHASGAVYRPGALHQIFKWFGRGMVPVIQGTDETLIDLISTETAASFIARAAELNWESGSIWQIAAAERAAPLHDLVSLGFLKLSGRTVVENTEKPGQPFIVDRETFNRLQSEQCTPRQRAIRQAMESLSSFLPMLLYPRLYDTSNAQRFWGGPLPLPDWKVTMTRVIQYLDMARIPPDVASRSEAA